MRHRSFADGFTLIELLVAMAVGAVLLVSLLSVLSGSINVSRKANDTLLGANAAAAALDIISTDLESLAVTPQPNFEYLRLASETVGDHGVNGGMLIFLTSSANDTSTSAADSGQVRAVVYRLGYQDVVRTNGTGTNKIYGIYRSVETNAATVFSSYLGQSNLSGTSLFTASSPPVADFLAGNIVDFRVRFYAPSSLTPLNTNNAVRINGTNIIVGTEAKNTNAATAEVSVTYLEGTGAKLLQTGALTDLEEVKKRYGYTLSRKVPIRTPVSISQAP